LGCSRIEVHDFFYFSLYIVISVSWPGS
jgi:hypothetical protein